MVEKNKKEEKQEEIDYKDLCLRTQANFENFRKQTEKRLVEMRKFAANNVITELLPIIDNFELALKLKGNANNDFVTGIELIYSQFMDLLKNQGIKKIKVENIDFDPYMHEAIAKMDSIKPENTIIECVQTGYILEGKVLRHAKVKVSSGKKPEEEKKNV